MIKIISLVENTSSSPELKSKHGLSIYVETIKHKILFDLGPNALFLENAQKLGVDIKLVDTVIISHGHSDHGGALAKFMEINKTAKIYIKESAFDGHCTKVAGIPFNVGLDNALRDRQQIIFTSDNYIIDDELMLFSNVIGRKLFSKANDKLFAKKNGKIVLDQFEHEQYLIVTNGNKQVMITGCSHNGIVNIIEKYVEIYNGSIDKLACVIGGFHLFNPITRNYESDELISEIAEYLGGLNAKFYTCHCTGKKAYKILKDSMGEQLGYFSTGTRIEY
ncbi:MAG: MBL fold metallo-hydrolase [Lachnospiraceae bacterium]|nr:MBL fold metallo-hydrolase [Lachnospiraceae bacterium]